MIEIRCHGRGGTGAKMTAHTLGVTAFLSGYETQDFALYGAERRGAPITSFVRYDKKGVKERGYITEPDAIIILDETLNFDIMLRGLKPKGFIFINSSRSSDYFKKKYKIKNKVYSVDATSIAMKIMGRPIANMTLLGAFVKEIKLPEKNLEKAIRVVLTNAGHPEAIEKNIEASKECGKMLK